jgi:hypothetical protein
MPSLSAIPFSHKEVYLAAGAVFFLILTWIWARYGRRRYVVIRASEPILTATHQLGRIADAIEHLAVAVERAASSSANESGGRVSMSMFGR